MEAVRVTLQLHDTIPPVPVSPAPLSPLQKGKHGHQRVKWALHGLWLSHRQHGTLYEGQAGQEALQPPNPADMGVAWWGSGTSHAP